MKPSKEQKKQCSSILFKFHVKQFADKCIITISLPEHIIAHSLTDAPACRSNNAKQSLNEAIFKVPIIHLRHLNATFKCIYAQVCTALAPY